MQEGAVGVGAVEHETLRDPGDPHRGDVKQDANHPQPEVEIGEAFGEQLRIPESRGEPVEQTRRHEAVPAQSAAVDVSNRPVGVVREGVDRFDRHEGALEGRHPVEGNARRKEFNNGVGAEFIPCATEGEEAVQHAAPGGRPKHEREEHPEGLQPVGEGGVEQVVRTCPDVDKDERPEVDNREPVGIDRTIGGLWHEIIHDPEDRGGEEERHRVVAIPPLNEGVLHPAEEGIAVGKARREREVVDHVEHGNRDDGGDVEPDRDVDAALVALREGPEKVCGEDEPDDRDH